MNASDPRNPASPRGRPARKNTEITPTKPDETPLETYERSPERGSDERTQPATPDGPLPERDIPTPD
jgi:hypothetical protein